MFTLTSAAAQQIQQAANDSGAQEMALRVAARLEPDGSLQYGMGFDDPKEEDLKLYLDGVPVVISGESQELLDATVLDYVELTPGEFNFIFSQTEPFQCASNQATAGGCGSGACSSGGCSSKGPVH
jgi:iron-sulfur cluster assembly protein